MKTNSKLFDSLIINKGSSFLKIATLRNGEVWQFFYQSLSTRGALLDDIYLGKVTRVTPQFIWVDIGETNPGVIKRKFKEKPLIEGQKIFVQISKEEINDDASHKGPRLTRNIHITGKFCSYHPLDKNIFFSKNLSTITKQELLALFNGITNFTFRTACDTLEDVSLLQKEMDQLKENWDFISQSYSSEIGLLQKAPTILERLLRDTGSNVNIVFDDVGILAASKKYIINISPNISCNLRLASLKEQPLFEYLGIQEDWEMLTDPLVPITTGGNLYIEETACATTIDVNAGEKSPETINFEAIIPIIQQIRLRQLSGNILIDFVRMPLTLRKKLLIDFENHLKNENTQGVKVLGWSHLGFLELQASRHQDSLTKQLKHHI
ncbi:MAG: ribonuclease E/G [Alphaproteobacteria bacterium]|nr:ribonuclease E/G [Alphaproteobacteria bacterium]